ncbi:MAG: hypothetical protein NTV51_15800 [Verrucomicrobia bacterium]|nr:hypothetical protein [Verrucomicrobiota bacterium]
MIKFLVVLLAAVAIFGRISATDALSASPVRIPLAERVRKETWDAIGVLITPFFERTKVLAEKRHKVLEILVQVTERNYEVVKRFSPGQGLALAQFAANRQWAKERLVPLLGVDLTERALLINESRSYRESVVAVFEARCVALGVPASSEQAEQLGLACDRYHIPLPAKDGQVIDPDSYRLLTEDDRLVIAEATKFLSARQLELFKQALAERYAVR